MKLYKVTCRGMNYNKHSLHGVAYVVAPDSEMAYQELLTYLNKKDLGFQDDRELKTVELIAEESDYPKCGIRLFICGKGIDVVEILPKEKEKQ